jgi:hypothetical protein
MHAEAMGWVRKFATTDALSVLDIGGRFINGTPRICFPNASPYTVLDIAPGPGVAIVADASTWEPTRTWDMVISTEVFEHTPVWPQICATAFEACAPGGLLVLTMAGPGRDPHSGVDGGPLRDGEHYANVDPDHLLDVLVGCGFVDVEVNHEGTDVRAAARKPEGELMARRADSGEEPVEETEAVEQTELLDPDQMSAPEQHEVQEVTSARDAALAAGDEQAAADLDEKLLELLTPKEQA